MAHFHCTHCGYQQSASSEYLHRLARCPQCQHLDAIEGDAAAAMRGFADWRRMHPWRWRAALCGAGGLLTAFWICASLSTQRANDTLHNVKPIPITTINLGQSVTDAVRQHSEQLVPNAKPDRTDVEPAVQTVQPASKVGHENPARHDSTTSSEERPTATAAAADHATPVLPDESKWPMPAKFEALPSSRDPRVATEAHATDAPRPEGVVDPLQPKVIASKRPSKVEQAGHLDQLAEQVADGKRLFEHQWQPNDPLAGTGDGLGPVFNARSCVECHFQSGTGGSGTNAHNVQSFEVLPADHGAKVRDGVIHASAIDSSLKESKRDLSEMLGSPKVPFRRLTPKKNEWFLEADAVRTVFMNTPALWGNGVIDQITDQDLNKLEYTHPSIGRLRRYFDGKIGKFGWKAQITTLRQFVGSACAAELGLTNSVRSQQKPQAYEDDSQAPRDLTDDQVTSLVQFVASLPAPQQILPQDATERRMVTAGEKLFSTIGCATCHVKDVGPAHGVYSDFRLHHIDSATAKVQTYYVIDATPVFQPPTNYPKLGEWKTPPLWGLADTAPYWHDGSAHTISDAILKHQEEGATSKAVFESLTQQQKDQLLAFLTTLKAPIQVK